MANYGKVEYWEDRYQKDKEQFDWLQRYYPPLGNSLMREMINTHVPQTAQVLIVGCGSSRMTEEMYEDGYQNITSIDLSYSAVKLQQEEYKERYSNLTFKQMDVRNLQFKDGTFDAVIDKGLLDAMVCTDGSKGNTESMLKEIHRVLAPTGTYICVTHGKEDQRKKYLKNVKLYNWNRIKMQLPKPVIGQNVKDVKAPNYDDKKNFHFMYICKK